MKNSSFFESKLQEKKYITEEIVFFQTLSQCFSQMYYDDKGILKSRTQKDKEEQNEEMTLCPSLDEVSTMPIEECCYADNNQLFSYEITSKPQKESNYDMVDMIYNKVVHDDPLDIGDFSFSSNILSTPILNILANSNYHK